MPNIDIYSVISIAKKAGDLIMEYYNKNPKVNIKQDNSPVTDADIAANDYITEQLFMLTPDIPIVAEENTNNNIKKSNLFWLVDPLDGTESFIKKLGQFTVNIGLIKDSKPILGVIYLPYEKVVYFAKKDTPAYKIRDGGVPETIHSHASGKQKRVIISIGSKKDKEVDHFLKQFEVTSIISAASALKFCFIAEGMADIYPRFGRTMEWDTAAGHAILNSAGGSIIGVDQQPILYGKDNFENPAFIALGKEV